MSTSILDSPIPARRRKAVLCRTAGLPTIDLRVVRALAPYFGQSGSEPRKRLYAIALIVLELHFVAALEMREAFMSNAAIERPRTPEVELEVLSRVPDSAPVAHSSTDSLHRDVSQPAQRPTTSPGASRSHGARATNEPHRAPTSARTVPAEVPTRSNTPGLKSGPIPADSLNEDAASPETPRPSNAEPQSSQPTPKSVLQPVTEPGFGAAYLHNPAPAYPAVALQRGWQGTVFLKVHVLANGHPDHILLASSSGHESLDDAATEVVATWTFVPARRGEQAIDDWVQVPVDFKLGT